MKIEMVERNLKQTAMKRRPFLTALGGSVTASLLNAPAILHATSSSPSIFKAVKVSMITGNHSVLEMFQIAKRAGFDGISLFAPDRFDATEAIAAQRETGVLIHNVNNAVHWKQRLSDPDPAVRRQSIEALSAAIRFAHQVGASSVLLVVGKVTDPKHENHDQVWTRSIDGIRTVLPLAAKLGVRILCENVGNGFCETAEEWRDYLDTIADPSVGAFFDIGNHQSKGGAEHWIRTLGHRIVKLDVKGHDSTIRKNGNIFDGDVRWEAVREELAKLNFTGWATAEVKGGDEQRLAEVADRMNQALGINA